MKTASVVIEPPKFETAAFKIIGTSPLVIHRFSAKTKEQMLQKQITGKAASSKKNRQPQDPNQIYNEARYISPEGWDGINATAFRHGLISVCRLVGFKMTLAKLSLFVVEDGRDAKEPQIPLIRIFGSPVRQDDMARVETGQPYVTIRPAYHDWSAIVRIRWDLDQFTVQDVTNLLVRVGMQSGIGEGRPDSKNSGGMGWGLFMVQPTKENAERKTRRPAKGEKVTT